MKKKTLTIVVTIIIFIIFFQTIEFLPFDDYGYTKIIKIKEENFNHYDAFIEKLDDQNLLLIEKNKNEHTALKFNLDNEKFNKIEFPVTIDYFANNIRVFEDKIFIDKISSYKNKDFKEHFAIINKDTMQVESILSRNFVSDLKDKIVYQIYLVSLNSDTQLLFSAIGNKLVIGRYNPKTKNIEKIFEKEYVSDYHFKQEYHLIDDKKILIFGNLKLKGIDLNFDTKKYQPIYEYDYSKNQIKLIGKSLNRYNNLHLHPIEMNNKVILGGETHFPLEIFDIKEKTNKILFYDKNKKMEYVIPIKYNNNHVAIIPITEEKDFTDELNNFGLTLLFCIYEPSFCIFERIWYFCYGIFNLLFDYIDHIIFNHLTYNNIYFLNLETNELIKGRKMPFNNFNSVVSLDNGGIAILSGGKIAILKEWDN